MSIVLASGSPRRKELLALIAPDFEIITSDVDESAITAASPKLLSEALATSKCNAVAALHPADTVIGCDTVVDFDGTVFGKPKDKAEARAFLQALSGTDHFVHTGVCICKGEAQEVFSASTRVRFYPLTEEQIEAYIATDEPYDKAGGYGIQGAAALFCEEIEGCYYNIMGLPVAKLARSLKNF